MKRLIVLLTAMAVMSVGSAVVADNVYIDDGLSHIISDSTHVNDTLWLDYHTDNSPGTHIEMVDGGKVALFLPFNNSTITIHGGTVDRGNVAIDTKGDNLVTINGGTFIGDIASNNNSRIYVNGGTFNDDFYAYNTGRVEISGGSIDGILGVFDSGIISLEGNNFRVDGIAVDQGDSIRNYATISTSYPEYYIGTITGTLLDGSAINNEFWIWERTDADIIIIPEPMTIKVAVDIKPGSCPNPLSLNTKGKGVIPVAILGSEDFDVFNIDITTITLEGVAPIRSSFEDVSTPFEGEECECSTEGPDGFYDLTLKFNTREILAALQATYGDLTEIENKTDIPLTLKAMLIDEDVKLEGTDCIRLLK